MLKRNSGISKKIMLAALAASMVITPTFNVNAATSSNSTVTTSAVASETSASSVAILESEGWLESANVEWSAVTGATGYNVYYKSAGASDSEYKQLDNQLIRQYSSYFRADALGLAEGNYVIKIVPIINNAEVSSKQAITQTLAVKANTREGFAFSKQSPMKTGSGGYNDNGTVPADANIIYITADTVNTVKADVVTNSKGTKTTCTGLANILAARQKGYDQSHLIIRMVGEIKGSDITGLNSNGYLELKGCYNVTLEGVGKDATVYQWGILVRNAHNVEIRNLGLMLFPDDGISLDTDNENIWVHNNDIFYGSAGSDADQVKGDGSCDVKLSDYITVAYNHFHDSGKCSLCGMSDSQDFHVTYHHNWFDHSDSRHPRIRVGTIHIYNNYFDGNAKYGTGVTKGSSAFVENNYFRNCKHPMLSSLQGTDIYNNAKGGFSGEAGGMIKAYNNKVEGAERLVYANQDPTQFDAYLASSRNEAVPSTYKTVSGGTTYNNFDTSATMYSYTPDSPEAVQSKVTTYAGRINGGDFIWNFTTADDTDSGVNAALMAKIRSYTSDLKSVGGNSVNTSNSTGTDTGEGTSTGNDTGANTGTGTTTGTSTETGTTQVSAAHNFTTSNLTDTFFAITGSLSATKGTVSYNNLTLTQCLKMESASSIKFATTSSSNLTLVFNSTFNGNVLIDGNKYAAKNGVLNVTLSAGNHTITKADSCNLYYIALV